MCPVVVEETTHFDFFVFGDDGPFRYAEYFAFCGLAPGFSAPFLVSEGCQGGVVCGG